MIKKNGYSVVRKVNSDKTTQIGSDGSPEALITNNSAEYQFSSLKDGFVATASLTVIHDYKQQTTTLNFSNLTLKNPDYQISGISISMPMDKFVAMDLGDDSNDDLSGVENSISNELLPLLKDSNNVINIKNTKGYSIDSGDGNDSINGNTGADTITAGNGDDSVNSGAGNDLIVGGDGAGNDNYDGGSGIDTVKYTSAKASITVDLSKGTATSTAGNDAAGIGNDKLKNIEYIIAGDYADTLIGSQDVNSIVGGSGNDTIDGGLGKDTLVGGDGSDTFVFSTALSATNVDTITDFQVGVDKIQLNSKIFTKLNKSTTDYLAYGSASDSKSHYLIYDSATGKLSYDADGNLTKFKPIDIALIGQGLQLTAQDIVIV